ncbi:MAG: hypothetical protein KAS95_05340, partial [Candidatus Heimdallarchaeota archaeon]|nr:hypothetical protein [Candidatus Heimdallarchaeota archaeon]
KMHNLAEEINYTDGLALCFTYKWFIEKFQGDKISAKRAMDKSLEILNQLTDCDRYIHHFILYSYAVEKWLEERDPKSSDILEECTDYFFQNGFYRSLVQTLGILLIIYQRTQNTKKVLKISEQLVNKEFFEQIPQDVQACSYFFMGMGYMLRSNLSDAEIYFEKSRKILKESYKSSIYFTYYLTTLSYFPAIKALQGKLDQAIQLAEETEKLLQDGFIQKNLDKVNKRQITHTFNLTKFYVQTRKKDCNIEESSELIKKLYSGTQINYSDAIMLSEFLLNAQLSYEQLQELQKKDNVSLKRVKHITSFMMEKTRTDVELTAVELLRNCIVTLWKRRVPKDDTFVEQSFVDLFLAQQYYEIGRFDEMNKLLKPYSDNLDSIEVLEQRLFIKGMMYFAAHRSGDIFAPSKFYKTIQECKSNDFTRLEELLTSYIGLPN